MSLEIFAKRIKELRLKYGLSTRMMGEKLGITHASVIYYEQCKREPTLSVIKAYANYFNVTTDYLLGLDNYTLRKEK